jgi:hypothetical protein
VRHFDLIGLALALACVGWLVALAVFSAPAWAIVVAVVALVAVLLRLAWRQ